LCLPFLIQTGLIPEGFCFFGDTIFDYGAGKSTTYAGLAYRIAGKGRMKRAKTKDQSLHERSFSFDAEICLLGQWCNQQGVFAFSRILFF